MANIRHWIEAESAGHCFFYVFPFALVALLIWFKGRRSRFLIPVLILTVVIINPFFYQKWDELGLYAYWRILWILPVIPVLAAIVPGITERIGRTRSAEGQIVNGQTNHRKNRYSGKTAVLAVVAAGIWLTAIGGTYLYNGNGGNFGKAENPEKLWNTVVEVADRLLELKDHPRIIADYDISVFIREYSGEIETMFGRDLHGYIAGVKKETRAINDAINAGEWETVNQVMLDDGYDFLVTEKETDDGFELVDVVDRYGIYSAVGTPTVIKERNELGQVTGITIVDENGVPVNNDSGYSTKTFEYDSLGRTIREFHTNTDGMGVADLDGVAGYEREYDDRSHIIMERKIGPDGTAVAGSAGYVEYRRVYEGKNLVQESYFDGNGEPVNRIDTLYASVTMEYDEEHHKIAEQYYDTAGRPVIAANGYAMVKRIYDEMGMMREESYYDETGMPVIIPAGYAAKRREYDEAGNIIAEAYFDDGGAAVNCINGYAKTEKEYDEEKNVVMQRFLDSDGKMVVTGAGYAEVRRLYQEDHLTRETYYGPDGKEWIQPAGYCAIQQLWKDDELYARLYLGTEGYPVNRTDGYAKAVWEPGETCTEVNFYSADGAEIEIEGLNLAQDVKAGEDGWSNWLTPGVNVFNSTQTIGSVNLGQKAEGDVYTCQLEIEFKGVTATEEQVFNFRSQGKQDSRWYTGNPWNRSLVELNKPPEDGVYTYTVTNTVSGAMTEVSTFSLGFRCDYWASGSYRVRFVKIEKGDTVGAWTPGL